MSWICISVLFSVTFSFIFSAFFFSLSFYISFCICKLRSIEWKRERERKIYLSTSFIQFEVDIKKSLSKSLIRLIKNMWCCLRLARKHAPLIDRISFLFVYIFFLFHSGRVGRREFGTKIQGKKIRAFDFEPHYIAHTLESKIKMYKKCNGDSAHDCCACVSEFYWIVRVERGEFVKWPFRRWCDLREKKNKRLFQEHRRRDILV